MSTMLFCVSFLYTPELDSVCVCVPIPIMSCNLILCYSWEIVIPLSCFVEND